MSKGEDEGFQVSGRLNAMVFRSEQEILMDFAKLNLLMSI